MRSYCLKGSVYFMHSDPQQLVQWVTRATQIHNETCSRYGDFELCGPSRT